MASLNLQTSLESTNSRTYLQKRLWSQKNKNFLRNQKIFVLLLTKKVNEG